MTTQQQKLLIKIKSLFPEAVTEVCHNDENGNPYYVYAIKESFIEKLRGVGLDLADDKTSYGLQFPGKRTAESQCFTPSFKTLIPDKGQSKNYENTDNVFIEGDNLDALRILRHSYTGKIKVIYIDPPYNTGSDGFVYNDDFSVKQKEYLKASGILDDDGVRTVSEVSNGLSGKFHSKWLAMMYPRLKLSRELLTDDGVIFISIDDNESANLRLICDEIFGEDRFCGAIKRRASRKTAHLSNDMSDICDYILVYSKHTLNYPLSVEVTQDSTRPVIQQGNKLTTRILRVGTVAKCKDGVIKKGVYTTDSTSIEFMNDAKIESGVLQNETLVSAKFRVNQDLLDQTVYITRNLSLRRVLLDNEKGKPKVMSDLWDESGYYNEKGTETLTEVLEADKVFQNPKPVDLIKSLCRSCSQLSKDCYVLDFFAGSATTAQSVIELNADDNGSRKFILVQRAEAIIENKSPEAYKFCIDNLKRPANIAEIAKERIRKAGEKIQKAYPDEVMDIGFRVFTITDSLLVSKNLDVFNEVDQSSLLELKTNLSPKNFEQLLYEAIFQTGVPLNSSVYTHKIGKYPFAICERSCYCVTSGLTHDIVCKIVNQYGCEFDMLYYLSDCPTISTSHEELESAMTLSTEKKEIKSIGY